MSAAMQTTVEDSETAPAASCSTGSAIATAKQVRWSVEEAALIATTALQNEDVLFGCLKGVATKGISRQRAECWATVSGTWNGKCVMSTVPDSSVFKNLIHVVNNLAKYNAYE